MPHPQRIMGSPRRQGPRISAKRLPRSATSRLVLRIDRSSGHAPSLHSQLSTEDSAEGRGRSGRSIGGTR